MENTAINFLTPFLSETKAAATGKTPGSSEDGSSSFLDMLSRLTSDGSTPVDSGSEEGGNVAPFCLADGSPVLSDSDVQCLLNMIEAIAAGTAVEGDDTSGSATGVGTGSTGQTAASEKTPKKEVESLLLGFLALFMMKDQAADASGTNGVSDGATDASNTLQGLALGTETSGGETDGVSETTLLSPDGSSRTPSGTGDQTTLEMLALIVFNSLQALQEKQEQAGSSSVTDGEGQSPAAGGTEGLVASIEGDVARTPAFEGARAQTVNNDKGQQVQDSQGVTIRGKTLEGFLKGVLGSGDEGTQSDDGTTAGAEIELAPAGKEDSASSKLTLTINGVFKRIDQNGQQNQATVEAVASTGAQGNAQEDGSGSVAATTIVEDLSPLLDGKGEGSHSHDAGTGGKSSDEGQSQFMAGNDTSRIMAQEPKEKAATQTTSAGAVEKFQRVLDQFTTKASSHDLTVRLDIGNKESLLLGFKDMGENIAVEVRASHQAVTDLLQNQRDAIVKHLESKDIHATIQIDPDASATTDGRDRRETREMRQRSFVNQTHEDGGFGEYLEVFA